MVAMSCEQFEARYDDSADYARAHHHDSAYDDSANTRPAWSRPLPLPQRRGEAQGEGHEGARRTQEGLLLLVLGSVAHPALHKGPGPVLLHTLHSSEVIMAPIRREMRWC